MWTYPGDTSSRYALETSSSNGETSRAGGRPASIAASNSATASADTIGAAFIARSTALGDPGAGRGVLSRRTATRLRGAARVRRRGVDRLVGTTGLYRPGVSRSQASSDLPARPTAPRLPGRAVRSADRERRQPAASGLRRAGAPAMAGPAARSPRARGVGGPAGRRRLCRGGRRRAAHARSRRRCPAASRSSGRRRPDPHIPARGKSKLAE